jgi:hypothetical protein
MEDMNSNGHRPEANQLIRKDFGGTSISRETQATQALVAKARADIEARWTMAMHRPRNIDQVRTSIMKECRRPGFAAAAIYRKPVGDGVEGLSIRFAEAAARCFGNIAMEVTQIYDDETTRVVRVSATDLEANITWPQDVTVSKTVERRQLRKGQKPVAERTNSYGDRVYLVEASDDDLLNKQGALVSKALRTCILRIIPGNLQDEAYDICNAILKDESAKDPDAARNAVCDAFSGQGVQPTDLEEWLGHKLDVATPAEIEQLRRLFVAIRDGEATWPDALTQRAEQLATKAPKSKLDAAVAKVEAKADPNAKGTSAVKDKLKGRNAKPEQQALPVQPATTPAGDPEDEPGWMKGPPDDR